MKKIFTFLIIIFLSSSANAECQYHYYHIKFTIETNDGKIRDGYVEHSPCILDMDSLENTEYLKKAFNWLNDKEDTLTYFQDRIEYKCQIWEDSEGKNTVYYYLNKKSIPFEDIKTIKIENLIDLSGWIDISNDLQLQDSIWMKKEPVKKVSFWSDWGFVHSHYIFVHIDSKKINDIIKQIELKWKELEKIDTDRHRRYDIDEEIMEIIKKLKGEKVVVVSEYSD